MANFDNIIDRRNTGSMKWDECPAPDVLPLWVADMDFPTAPCVQEAVMRRATHGCYGYTMVPDAYYEAIIDWFATRHGWNIGRNEILYTIGVVPAIAATLKAVCQTGDNVVLLTPVYNIFFNLVRNAGCQTVEVPLLFTADDRRTLHYAIDWEALADALALEKTTVLLLCNPHNPVGRIWTADELSRIARLCAAHGVTLVADEIHNELAAPHLTYTPLGRVMADGMASADTPRYVICASPSKSFNTAGLQNAFLVVADADLRRRIDRAINLNEVCDVNPFGIEATIAAYTEGGEWLDELRRYLWDNYLFVRDELLRGFPDIAVADLQATYLMWVDCRAICERKGVDDKALADELLENGKVWLCAGSDYGKAGAGFLRINLACPRATLREAVLRLTQTLSPALSHNGEGAVDTIV